MATDPDADRLGVYVKDAKTGEYHSLTGNMSGCLLAEYTISQIKEKQGLPEDGALIKTIVTTNLADAIAKSYGIRLIECLTGFKYIGQQILGFEQSGKGNISVLDLRRAMDVLLEHMQEIRMLLLQQWLFVKLLHITRLKVCHFGIR